MVERVTRFGVSAGQGLIDRFDEAIKHMGYSNRSKAICDAITDFLSQKSHKERGHMMGTISYVYDHHFRGVNSRLVEIQHGFEGCIRSTMHSHISAEICLEVLIVEGDFEDVNTLFGRLGATRGVKNCKLSTLLAASK